jgi:cyanophycinase-like exopeptidase
VYELWRNILSPMQDSSLTGPLALLGSGEFLPVMADLDRSLLEGRPQRVVHLPTAAGLEGEARLRYWADLAASHFDDLGVEVETLPVLDRATALEPVNADRISGAGMVFMSGGNPGHLVESLRGTALWASIVDAWRAGAALVGCSAGAMAVSAALPAFRTAGGEALGLLPGISVIPHYDRFGKMMKPIVRLHDRDVTVVGIDENTALHGGPEAWSVYGSGAVHVFGPDGKGEYRAGDRVNL